MGRKWETLVGLGSGIFLKMRWENESRGWRERGDDVRWVRSGVVCTPVNEICSRCPLPLPRDYTTLLSSVSDDCPRCFPTSQVTPLILPQVRHLPSHLRCNQVEQMSLWLTLLSCIYCLFNHAEYMSPPCISMIWPELPGFSTSEAQTYIRQCSRWAADFRDLHFFSNLRCQTGAVYITCGTFSSKFTSATNPSLLEMSSLKSTVPTSLHCI